MIDRFADWFAGVLLEKGVITEDELEVQVYGIQTILSNLLSYGVVLAVSWAFGVLPLSAVFLAVYTVLRKTVGGWHAKTPFSCAVQYCRMGRGAVACGRCRKERCTAVCSVGGGMPGALVQGPLHHAG